MVRRITNFSMSEKWSFAGPLCSCFATSLEKGTKGYEALQRLITLRNNMAHANISRDIKTYLFVEDGMEFVVSPDLKAYKEAMDPGSIRLASVEEIKSDVDAMAQRIISAMKPRYRKQFPKLMNGNSVVLHHTDEPRLMDQWL
jgi:hypothetical protein